MTSNMKKYKQLPASRIWLQLGPCWYQTMVTSEDEREAFLNYLANKLADDDGTSLWEQLEIKLRQDIKYEKI